MVSAEFQKAYEEGGEFSKNPKDKQPSDDEALQMYGLAKIAQDDPPKAPGMFDLKRKAMYNRWKKLTDEGVTQEDAEKKYIELVNQLKAKFAA